MRASSTSLIRDRTATPIGLSTANDPELVLEFSSHSAGTPSPLHIQSYAHRRLVVAAASCVRWSHHENLLFSLAEQSELPGTSPPRSLFTGAAYEPGMVSEAPYSLLVLVNGGQMCPPWFSLGILVRGATDVIGRPPTALSPSNVSMPTITARLRVSMRRNCELSARKLMQSDTFHFD